MPLPDAIFGIVLPISGIHRNLREAKATEIQHVTCAFHGNRSALSQTRLAEESQAVPISNLVIYRQTVMDISEWPLNSVAAVRMVTITGVPIVAWIGGALGERFQRVAGPGRHRPISDPARRPIADEEPTSILIQSFANATKEFAPPKSQLRTHGQKNEEDPFAHETGVFCHVH